jgi:uncharacterized protein YqiB (DUF1249 family)
MRLPSIAPDKLLPGRFVWLMDLYEENYLRLERIFGTSRLVPDRYLSSVGDGLDVVLEVLDRQAHTTEIRLSYALVDPATGLATPSAVLRVYRDARLAEATHCLPGRQLVDVLGAHAAPKRVLDHRMRMNSFLSRWLDYLAEHGHSWHTLTIADQEPQESQAAG